MRKAYLLVALAAVAFTIAGLTSMRVVGKGQKLITPAGAIPNRYIVILDESLVGSDLAAPAVEANAQYLTAVYGGDIDTVYSNALKGFSVQMSPDQAVEMSDDPNVLFIEADTEISTATSQINPVWNLDRVDQRNMPLNGSYDYSGAGSGVHAYILDTGIRATHTDFGGRASAVYDNIGDGQNGNDCNGHGTHVAGIIGSATYGVAKDVSLHGVRVMPCAGNGQISNLLAGIDWVTANRVDPAVANISLAAAGQSPSLEGAITNSIASGVTFVVASGNGNWDACNFTPARTPSAITVGASDEFDVRALYSNYGACIDIFAPGNLIVSTWASSDTATANRGGSSQAAPMVAGSAAVYLGSNPSASPSMVAQAILNTSTTGVLTTNNAASPNRLLYSWVSGAPSPTPTPTPRATIRVRKRVQGAATENTPAFQYQAVNLASPSFALQNNQDYTDPNVNPNNTQNPIVVTEQVAPGWELVSISCTELSGGPPNNQNTTVDLVGRRATIVAEAAEQVECTFTSQIAPTAGGAVITGRVADQNGRGIRGVRLALIDIATGGQTASQTNAFGAYYFEDVPVGRTYLLVAFSNKRWTIDSDTRSFVLNEDLADIDFIANVRW